MTKRKLIILSLSLVSLAIIIGGIWYWYSEQRAEQRLQDYIEGLKIQALQQRNVLWQISK